MNYSYTKNVLPRFFLLYAQQCVHIFKSCFVEVTQSINSFMPIPGASKMSPLARGARLQEKSPGPQFCVRLRELSAYGRCPQATHSNGIHSFQDLSDCNNNNRH